MTEAERLAAIWRAARQEQFLDVASRDEAEARFRSHLRLEPLGAESVPLERALGRVLARDVVAAVDVPRLRPLQRRRLCAARRRHHRRPRRRPPHPPAQSRAADSRHRARP